ncbi:hypothetical protein V1511DRAFT_190046 [Dipodascopsis uninucleata]
MILFLYVLAFCRTVVSLFTKVPEWHSTPNIYVLTDISNEPDDAQSLTRLLLYSNEVKIHGISAVTSVWLNDTTRPDLIHDIINAYSVVHDTLLVHSPNFPKPEYLHAIVTSGSSSYGTTVLDEQPSEAVYHLISAIDALPKDETMWVQCWGGSATLAHALHVVRSTRSETELEEFLSKIRVYAISDQDNTGAWIRTNFPQLFYIVSLHAWNQYGLATWSGISGETHYKFDKGGPDSSLVSDEWLKKNIQIGRFGSVAYPNTMFIMEGDTPAFLYVIPNGLGYPESPEWGSWGGRYMAIEQSGLSRIFTDTADLVFVNGVEYKSNQATIWRWRRAFQLDFAARMQWTMAKRFGEANHAPRLIINGSDSTLPFYISLCANEHSFVLDASASIDSDGDKLSYNWIQYQEATATRWSAQREVPTLNITSEQPGIVNISVPESISGTTVFTKFAKQVHIILEVADSGVPQMRSYRRIIITQQDEKCSSYAHDEL